MDGLQPYRPENLLRRHARPAGEPAGIQAHIGWHSNKESKQQITLDVYAQAQTPVQRPEASIARPGS
jgi:hypothetical protein